MNFYKAKSIAKKNSLYLISIFLISVTLYLFFINTIALSIYAFFSDFNYKEAFDLYKSEYAFNITIFIFSFVVFGMTYKFKSLKKGGHAVAMDLEAKPVMMDTKDYYEKRILNIIEEISLASGIPPIRLYVLDNLSINAFVAGYSYDDAIICVTRGLMLKLNKEEIQGVVAHEFSHIFNFDMKLNLYLTSILHGILIIGILGWHVIFFPFKIGNHKTSYDQKPTQEEEIGAGIAGFFLIIGIFLIVLGSVGTLIGDSIKALIARQREFLADAGAVEFTRYPAGISNALKKIGGDEYGSYIKNVNTKTYSHFYFAQGGSFLIQTHPPLKKRILKIEPDWNGEFIIPFIATKKSNLKQSNKENMEKIIQSAVLLKRVEGLNKIDFKDIKIVKDIVDKIPFKLRQMARDGFSAQGVVLAILAKDDIEVTQAFIKNLKFQNSTLYYQFSIAYKEVKKIQRVSCLPLILMCIPSLKEISKTQYLNFRDIFMSWVWANDKIVFFEWTLKQILLFPLDLNFGLTKAVRSVYNFKEVKEEASYFIGFLLNLNIFNGDKKEFFDRVCKEENVKELRYINVKNIDFKKLEKVFNELAFLDDESTIKLFRFSIKIFDKNGKISEKNIEMLHAISSALRIPLSFSIWH